MKKARKPRNCWTYKQDLQLKKRIEDINGSNNAAMADILCNEFGRTKKALENRIGIIRNGERVNYQWSLADTAYLRNLVAHGGEASYDTMIELCDKFPERGYDRIRDKLKKLGISAARKIYASKGMEAKVVQSQDKDSVPTLCREEDGNPYYKAAKLLGGNYNGITGIFTINNCPVSSSMIIRALKQVLGNI